MKSVRCFKKTSSAFSIVEMIAVIAVIAILVGLLIPAIAKVKAMADRVNQKAQFASITVGLEAFREELGDYPDSSASPEYIGMQKLAEAMVGRDGFGFHPASTFKSNGMDPTDSIPLYRPDIDTYYTGDPDGLAANMASRKGPYLELDAANAVKLSTLYPDPTTLGSLNPDSYVLADKFKTVKNSITGKKTGMPILYYRANTLMISHSIAAMKTSIYNYRDNQAIIDLPAPTEGLVHDMSADPTIFYNSTVNPDFSMPPVPHNNESFILLSAGADGIYGTPDDIYNFEEN